VYFLKNYFLFSFAETPNIAICCTVVIQEKNKNEATTMDFIVPPQNRCATARLLEYPAKIRRRERERVRGEKIEKRDEKREERREGKE
jgi:hypothetical protein